MTGNNFSNILDGKVGAVSLIGLGGNDTYIVDNVGDIVVEIAGEGTADVVQTTLANYTLGAEVENLTFAGSGAFSGTGNGLDNVITGGTGNNTLSGGAGNDTLTGGSINDTLDGGFGNDTMTGGAGNDTYIVDSAGDIVMEGASAGIDTVRSTLASYTLGANVENLMRALGSEALSTTAIGVLADFPAATKRAEISFASPLAI